MTVTRTERRKAATRASLVAAAQTLLAEGRESISIADIAAIADVGTGTFYNHFDSREALFAAAVEDALELLGSVLDDLTLDNPDPAEVFAQAFRLAGRLHRDNPMLSRVLLRRYDELLRSERGLGPRARRDIEAAAAAGRFSVPDVEATMLVVAGSVIAMGTWIHDHPDADADAKVDAVTADLLRMLGLPADEAAEMATRALPPRPID